MIIKLIKKSTLFVYIFTLVSMIPVPAAHAMHEMEEFDKTGEVFECMACSDEVGECYHLEVKTHTPNNSGQVKNFNKFELEEKPSKTLYQNFPLLQNPLIKESENLKLLDSVIIRC